MPSSSTEKRQHKVLILGSGSVGKSTVFKAIKRVNDGPLSETEVKESRHVIRQNLVSGILTLLKKSQELHDAYNVKYESTDQHKSDIINGYCGYSDISLKKCLVDTYNDDIVNDIKLIVNYGTESFTEDIDYVEIEKLGDAIYNCWKLDAIQQTFMFRLKRHYSFPSNMDYFFNKCKQIMKEEYIPTEQDILKLRIRTTGMVDYICESSKYIKHKFRIVDVGGERNERKKWIHEFENVSCILYVTGCNQYCKSIFEDEKQIGLLESLQLFDEVVNSKWFRNTIIVLLLNKPDLFKQNLKITPLTFCFGDQYKGRNYKNCMDNQYILRVMKNVLKIINNVGIDIPNDIALTIGYFVDICEWRLDLCFDDGMQFIQKKFVELNRSQLHRQSSKFLSFKANDNKPQKRKIYTYQICAIQPAQIEKILQEIQQLIIDKSECDNNQSLFHVKKFL